MGNPVAHSQSPWIHARFAELTGQVLGYERLLVPPGGLAQAVREFRAGGGRGCNITVPFKFEAAPLATRLSARAELAGACNTLRFDGEEVFADNTDGIGLVHDITRNAGVAIAGRRVLLVGAGGAAAGVLGPLVEAGPQAVVVANRTEDKARALVDRHAALAARHGVRLQAAGLQQPGQAFDLVVNASASSLAGGAVPVPDAVLRPGTLACDLMYGPAAQPFMDWARRLGAVPRDGLGMLVEQAAEAFQVWRGVRPPSAAVLDGLRERLARQ
ncbi:candidate shikimate 5-dehydrogenase [Ramlibacter tataouinensis TTB310]|uniref:Shikimate dehydrogenase (NADP(+)) n=2 Tax=Ramlibacter tataouinensis TaxID=94132 RepID=F5XZP2_RAMTT|nr:candidate shikimate 5-dehydrogenase [Ramlibacter tataouinensis TTB310]